MKYYAHFLASFESRVDINSRARKIETIKLFTVYFQLTTTAQRRMKEAQTHATKSKFEMHRMDCNLSDL